jgi:hypothetical protein
MFAVLNFQDSYCVSLSSSFFGPLKIIVNTFLFVDICLLPYFSIS